MKFTYETQGAITYLVCELEPTEQLDGITLGMLSNNRINGLAPVLYTEMDGQRFLKYNISAKIASNQFFGGSMNKQRAVMAFQNIVNALCSADDYMINQSCFSVLPEHVFLNVSNCEVALICIPVFTQKDIREDVISLFNQLIQSTQFDPNENQDYITQINTYLSNQAGFTVYGLRDLIQSIAMGATNFIQYTPFQQSPMPANNRPVPPVSSFNATVSIDSMPQSMMGGMGMPQGGQIPQPQMRPQMPQQPQFNAGPQSAPVQPQMPPQMSQQPRPQASQPQPRPINPSPVPQAAPKPNIPKPAAQNPGFAIPGQSNSAMGMKVPPKPGMPVQPQQPGVNPNAGTGEQKEKQMSFFSLMMHYNKENKATYKAQKETKKKNAATSAPKKPKKAPKQAGKPQPNAPVGGMQPQQQFVPQQPQPFVSGVQPVPVQNSFNETTVLSQVVSETTVLNASSMPGEPYLTRVKTGERITINKPVFRIGKERSYVDYFIADNTAISRSHCNIHKENGEYYIEDTNSTNHTYINGQIITSNVKTKISSGDKIRLANEDFTFTI